MGQRTRRWIRKIAMIAVAAGMMPGAAGAQIAPAASAVQIRSWPAGTPNSWIEKVVKNELSMIQQDDLPLRYRMRKVDRKGDTTRIVIESQQGTVARLIERDGQPITAAEDAAERSRLKDIVDSPEEFLKRKRRDGEGRSYASQLVRSMPRAMLYSYAPGQPQSANLRSSQVVVDFKPNPAFHPPTMVTEALTGIAGRMWIDEASGHLLRMEGRVLRPVNFGWGLIARVYPGGTVEFEQTCIDSEHCVSSHLVEDLTMREMMLKTVNDKTRMSAWNFEVLPAPLSFQQAVHELLDMKVPLR